MSLNDGSPTMTMPVAPTGMTGGGWGGFGGDNGWWIIICSLPFSAAGAAMETDSATTAEIPAAL